MYASLKNKPFEYLKSIRKEKNITSKQMAEKLRISKAFYCQLENRTRRLSYDMAIRISNIFNMKPDEIFYNHFKQQKNLFK